jgi:hypothetical protein
MCTPALTPSMTPLWGARERRTSSAGPPRHGRLRRDYELLPTPQQEYGPRARWETRSYCIYPSHAIPLKVPTFVTVSERP